MGTTYNLRDLGLAPGQAKQERIDVEVVPYVQGAIEFADDGGGGKAPRSKQQGPPPGIAYSVPGDQVDALLDINAMTEGTAFRLRFDATFTGPCARCLEPAQLELQVDDHAVHDERSDDEDMRSDHVDDKLAELDVTGWARESVGVRFPTRVLCRPDCRGLCGQCGENLNEHPDHAHEKPADSRWDALKDLKLDDAPE